MPRLRSGISKVQKSSSQGIKTLKSMVHAKAKKGDAKTLEHKHDRIKKLSDNLELLSELFKRQTAEVAKAWRKEKGHAVEEETLGTSPYDDVDIENQLVFR